MLSDETLLKDALRKARNAYGGFRRLQGITSYQAEIARSRTAPNGYREKFLYRVYRAVGGRIRVEEEHHGGLIVAQVINGLRGNKILQRPGQGTESVSELSLDEMIASQRAVKISPRVFLSHADEYDATYVGMEEIEGFTGPCLEFLEEAARYFFHPRSYLCLRMLDARQCSLWFYDDYRPVDGIATAHLIKVRQRDGTILEDRVRMSRYNQPIPEAFFALEV